MPAPIIFIATRGSALALTQARTVLAQCRAAFPDGAFELKIIKTTGDMASSASLSAGHLPKGLFTKELETALLEREADLAVHSLKDLPTELPAGLVLGAVSVREDVRDVLVFRDLDWAMSHRDPTQPVNSRRHFFRPALSLRGLPHGATVATSSTRRAAQVREVRPDVRIVPMRGNVGTRLRKLKDDDGMDATILARAGLIRLGFTAPAGVLEGPDVPPGLGVTALSIEEMLPCVGQAALGIEIRANDPATAALCARLNDPVTAQCTAAERALLSGLGGGCHLAVAGYAEAHGTELCLRGLSFLSGEARRGEVVGPLTEAAALGRSLAEELVRAR
jgi:hydroxymethylbilane synthase